MKKDLVFYFALCMLASCFILPRCKKRNSRLNITLYNQALPVIKQFISGKWKLEYTYGGYIANQRIDFDSKGFIWQIDDGIKIKQLHMRNLITDTLIEWYPESLYTGVGQTFIMKFFDKRLYPNNYVVMGIINDSLVLKDYGTDAMSYHFSKQN